MKYKKQILLVLFFSAYVFGLALTDQSRIVEFGLDVMTSSAEDTIRQGGMGDFASYIHAANFILENFSAKMDNWYLRHWAPGMAFLVALVIKLTGSQYYLLKMLLLTSLAWGALLTNLFLRLGQKRSHWLAFFGAIAITLTNMYRDVILNFGYFYTESLTVVFFIFGLLALYDFFLEKKGSILKITIFFALAIYMKMSLELILTITLLSSMAFVVLFRRPQWKIQVLDLAKIFLLLHVLISPWKIYNKINFQKYSLVSTDGGESLEWTYHWQLPHEIASFVKAGDTACAVDKTFCQLVNSNKDQFGPYLKQLTIYAFVSHPFKWYAYRLKNFRHFWTDIEENDTFIQKLAKAFEGFVYIFCGLASFVILFRQRESKLVSLLFLSSFVLSHFLLFSVVHFEPRYSIFLRFSFFIIFLLLSFDLKMNRKKT